MLVPVEDNPLDAVWTDRPPPPLGAVVLHDEKYSGEPAAHKIARIRGELAEIKTSAIVVSDPHAACWSFNIRGRDVAQSLPRRGDR